MTDLIIRGASVIDGTGRAPFGADVAISDGRITDIGDVDGPARRTIHADGLVLTPGFIDIHTHFDGQATWDPLLAPSSLHGVTTLALGNCGVGFAPAAPHRHDWLISLLEGVEDIPGTALAEGLPWNWESFPQYLDALDALPHAVDIAAHVPHAAIRTYVMGEDGANHLAHPSRSQAARMAALVAEGLLAGAIGFSTSRTEIHRSRDGHNIGTLTAGAEELLTIAEAMASVGSGVVQLISDLYQTTSDEFFDQEVSLLEQFVERSRRPLSLTMQQAVHAPDRWISQMSWVDSMVARGHDVKAQVSCRPIGVLLGLEATANPFMLCPSMGTLATLSLREKVAALSDPSFRARVLEEHERITPTVGPGILRELTSAFDSMFRLSDPVDYEMSGDRSLGAQALREGTEAAGLVYDELLADEGRRLVYLPLFNFAGGNFDVLEAMLNAPNTLLGLSDAGAHCGAICDASIPTTLLSLWARDRRDGPRMALERAVHLTTARNARHMGWHDRGVVAPGMLADLNLIEFDTLECRAPTIVHDLPAGGRRLMQTATGYRYTIKSGVVTFEDGQHTGATPGELLRAQR